MKKITTYSIISFLSATASSILFSLDVFAYNILSTGSAQQGADQAKTSDMPSTIFGNTGVFSQVVSLLLFLVGVLSVIMLIFGGLRYIISRGESKAVEAAKNTILYAIVGLVVSILSYAIVNFIVVSFTGANGGINTPGTSGSSTNNIPPTNV